MAFHLDFPPMSLDDVIGDGQSESESLPDRLGGEERVPDMVQMVRLDAASAVFHLDDDPGICRFVVDISPCRPR